MHATTTARGAPHLKASVTARSAPVTGRGRGRRGACRGTGPPPPRSRGRPPPAGPLGIRRGPPRSPRGRWGTRGGGRPAPALLRQLGGGGGRVLQRSARRPHTRP